jgi:hypothetical protein
VTAMGTYFRGFDNSSPVLRVGDFLYSPTRAFRLGLQDDGNLVQYAIDDSDPAIVRYSDYRSIFEELLSAIPYTRAIWATGTDGSNARSWIFQDDGNLVVYADENAQGEPVWASGSQNRGGVSLVCQDDGNLVIYSSDPGVAVWSSNTYAGAR